jgi:hypothetical protein
VFTPVCESPCLPTRCAHPWDAPPGLGVHHDLAVVPADSVPSAQWGMRLHHAMCDSVVGLPRQSVDAFLADLHRLKDDELLPVHAVTADRRGAVLRACWPLPGYVLQIILELTKDRELAVLDVPIRRMYNPHGKIDVLVTVGVDAWSPYLTRQLLADLLGRPDPGAPYVGLERAEHDFIEAYQRADGEYDLQYRSGGPDRHFYAATNESPLVHDVLWGWATKSGRWMTAIPWQPIDA